MRISYQVRNDKFQENILIWQPETNNWLHMPLSVINKSCRWYHSTFYFQPTWNMESRHIDVVTGPLQLQRMHSLYREGNKTKKSKNIIVMLAHLYPVHFVVRAATPSWWHKQEMIYQVNTGCNILPIDCLMPPVTDKIVTLYRLTNKTIQTWNSIPVLGYKPVSGR